MIQASSSAFFSLFYFLFSAGFILQSKEFIGAGITPENILARWLQNGNDEQVQLIQHQIVKTSGTFIIHCCLPLLYLFGYSYFSLVVDGDFPTVNDLIEAYPPFYYSVVLASLLVISAFTLVYYWSLDNWRSHPFAKKIAAFAQDNGTWSDVATDINNEFRRIDKLIIRTSPLVLVIVTDNWIVKVGQWPWKCHLAHQSDVKLELIRSVHVPISPEAEAGGVQYLTIQVENRLKPFEIRLKSTDYRDLESRLRGSIENIENIAIFKSVSERFVEVFRQHVESNPKFTEVTEVEPCIGCMAVPANTKLMRRCETSGTDACVTCYCRPMWCLTCLGEMVCDEARPGKAGYMAWLKMSVPNL